MKKVFFIVLVLLSIQARTQQLVFGNREQKSDYIPIQYTLKYDQIEGSPYLDERLLNGCVEFIKGDTVHAYLRYNIYNDAIEYLEGERLMELQNKNMVSRIITGKSDIVYRQYDLGNGPEWGYLVEEVSGKYSFFLKYRIRFQEAQPARSTYDEPKPARFVKISPIYLVSVDNGPITKTGLSKGDFERIAGDRFDSLDQFRKKNKLKFSDPDDLKRLFNFLNTQ